MAYRFTVYRNKFDEKWRWRFKASNGETMMASEGFETKSQVLDAIEAIKEHVPGASVTDETMPAPPRG